MQFILYYSEHERNRGLQGEIELIEALGVLKAFLFVIEKKNNNIDIYCLMQLVIHK